MNLNKKNEVFVKIHFWGGGGSARGGGGVRFGVRVDVNEEVKLL